ncbi:MAG TPA: glutamate-5-semialdehyde dehydrogenase [Candidatus Nitrosotenuis sp.]|jgi:glutamate-5-semialdehyde dehydrogenase|nr:glutamate-5-semialdehyde dehydrogenase [Candidatus Nitrosotenuis sp.]
MLETSLTLAEQAGRARQAAAVLAGLSTAAKDQALARMAALVRETREGILEANRVDLEAGERAGLSRALMDRLRLTPERIEGMARGLEEVRALPDPVGREEAWRRPNGLLIRRVRVPLGVLAVIYEARPNVTVEAASLCFKAGNACLLRGSTSARHSNRVLVETLRRALQDSGGPVDAVQAVADMRREAIDEMASMRGQIDCLIPRGGADLIQRVVAAARVPVIETGVGNCHLYVHEDADLDMALRIALNAKTQRPGVCNAIETMLVHRAVAERFLPRAGAALVGKGVELRGCPLTCRLVPQARSATPEDWDTEYLDLVLAVRVVEDLDQALEHIARHGSGHSEAIVTRSLEAARRFQQEVDACAVYVNASTRFTDGGEFGFGAEIGISTQKMHARGPLGLAELTTVKYLVEGEGQVRA